MSMIASARSVAYDLIDRYRLHDSGYPVDLSPLHDAYRIAYADLRSFGLSGLAVLPNHILIDAGLGWTWRRIALAHEVIHLASGHEDSFRLADVDDWFSDRQERAAWTGAAALLIPLDALDVCETDQCLASVCHVPVALVAFHPELGG